LQEQIEELTKAKDIMIILQELDSSIDFFDCGELDNLINDISEGNLEFFNKGSENLDDFEFKSLENFQKFKLIKEKEREKLNKTEEEKINKISEELKEIQTILDVFEINEIETIDELEEKIKKLKNKYDDAIKNKKSDKYIEKYQKPQEEMQEVSLLIKKFENTYLKIKNNENSNPVNNLPSKNTEKEIDLKNTDEFISYIEDGLELVECAEKYFNLIIGTLFLQNCEEEKLEILINRLKENFNIENCNKKDFLDNIHEKKNILENFEKLNSFLILEGKTNCDLTKQIELALNNYNNGFLLNSLNVLEMAFKKYRVLNVQELKRLIKHIDDAGNIINDKDIILLLGDTGAGKSTTIQFLLGMKMQKKNLDELIHIEGNLEEFIKNNCKSSDKRDSLQVKNNVQGINNFNQGIQNNNIYLNQLLKLKSSCFMRSETRNINAIQNKNNSIILCDTPGFRDSNGSEVDMANGISIIKAIHLAKSVRPVILISEKGFGDRGIELKKYANNITSIIPNLKVIKDKINFIFTKFKKNDSKKLYKIIENIDENLSKKESLNEHCKNFLYVLKMKLKNINSDFILDPLKDNHRDLLEHIQMTEPIQNPKEHFNYFISEDSINDINEQFRLDLKIIENCLKNNRFEIIKYKLNQMKFIYESTNNHKLKGLYDDISEKIKKHFEQIFKSIESQVQNLLKQEDDLKAENLISIKELMTLVNKSEIFKDFIPKECLPNNLLIENFINEKLNLLYEEIKTFDIHNMKVLSRIKKINAFCEIFPSYNQIVQKAKEEIDNKIKSMEIEAQNLISKSYENENIKFDFGKFKDLIEKLDDAVNNYNEYINQGNKNLKVDTFLNECYKFYQFKLNNCKKILNNLKEKKCKKKNFLNQEIEIKIDRNNDKMMNKDIIIIPNEENNINNTQKEKEIQYIDDFFDEIEMNAKIKMSFLNKELQMNDKFLGLEGESIKFINEIFEELEKKAIDFALQNDLDNFELAGFEIIKMQVLSTIGKTSKNLYSKLSNTIEKISKALKTIMKEIKTSLSSTFENKERFNSKTASNFIKNMDKFNWIQQFKNIEFNEFREELEEMILGNLENDIENIYSSDLNLDEFNDIKNNVESYERLLKIKEIFKDYKNLISIIDEPMKKYENSISNIKNNIKEVFEELKNFDNIVLKKDNKECNNNPNHNLESNNNKFEQNIITFLKNIGKLEKITKFLKNCKSLFNRKYKSIETFKNLFEEIKDFLENFKEISKTKIEDLYSNIENLIINKSFSDENENDIYAKYIDIIKEFKHYLNFFKRLFKQYTTIISMMDSNNEIKDILDIKIKEIFLCFKKETDNHQEEKEISKIKQKNFLLQETLFLDDFNFSDEIKKDAFKNLNDELKIYLKAEIPKIENEIEEYLNSGDYKLFENSLNSLEESKDPLSKKILDKNKHKIKNILEDRLQEAEKNSLDYIIKEDNLNNANQLEKKMQDIHKLLKISDSYLINKNEYKEKLKYIEKDICKTFANELTKLVNLNSEQTNIEDRITYMNKIKLSVKNCFDVIPEELKKNFNDLDSIVTNIQTKVRDEINEFKNKDLKDIIKNPPTKLKNKINKLKSCLPSEYGQELDDIIIDAVDKAKNKMEETINQDNFKELERNIKLSAKFFDEDHKKIIQEDLEKINKDLEEKLKNENQQIKNYINNNDYQHLYEFAEIINKRNDRQNKNLDVTRNYLSDKIKEIINNSEVFLKEKRLNEYLEIYFNDIRGILKFEKFFRSEINEFKKIEKWLFIYYKQIEQTQAELESFNDILNYKDKENSNSTQDSNILNENSYLLSIISKNENQKYFLNKELDKKIKDLKIMITENINSLLNGFRFLLSIQREKSLDNKKNIVFESNDINIGKFNFFEKFLENIEQSGLEIIKKFSKEFFDWIEVLNIYLKRFDNEKIIFHLLKIYIIDDSIKLINNNIRELKQTYPNEHQIIEKLKCFPTYLKFCENTLNSFGEIKNFFSELEFENYLKSKSELDSLIKHLENQIQILTSIKYFNALPEFPKIKDDFYSESLNILQTKIKISHDKLIKIINAINIHTSKEDEEFINNLTYFYHKSCGLNEIKYIFTKLIQDFEKIQEVKFDENMKKIEILSKEKKLEDISIELICQKFLIVNYDKKEEYYNDRFLKILINSKEKVGSLGISKIGYLLDKHQIGRLIIQGYKIFEGFEIQLFNSRTRNHDEKYVVENLEIEGVNVKEINKARLLQSYQKFKEIYENILKKNLINIKKESDSNLVTEIKDKFYIAKSILLEVNKSKEIMNWMGIIDNIPELLAYIFAEWTITNASSFFDAEDSDDRESYLLKPHPAQVISIFRILKIDERENLDNHLVQIKTGEGKSVVLGVLSIFFALMGINVYVACYSQYLSDRDFNYFSKIFERLGIFDRINYGTFNKLCESVLTNKIDIRKSVENFIKNGIINDSGSFKSKDEINILLIDEVDVFFSKDFYGNTYSPSIKITDPCISILLDKLWSERDKLKCFNYKKFKQSPEYLKCLNKFKDFSDLIETCVTNVIYDLKNYKDHDYILVGNQIGYKEQDNIIFNVSYGYKTMFAYYQEHHKNKIDLNILEEKKAFIVKCGFFAYAEIPKFFKFILGVTGTLKALNSEENKIINVNYNIKNKTFSPSVYGKSQFRFDQNKNFSTISSNDYFKIIADQIERGLSGTLKGTKRAVLVFFENKKILDEFYNSFYFSKLKHETKILTEETDKKEKDRIIRFSTLSGSITLLTRVFGRGTDFISNDETVINHGGLHILQTFFSEHLSEEIQIQGRTARQGQIGTYELILLDNDLEKFGYKKESKVNFNLFRLAKSFLKNI